MSKQIRAVVSHPAGANDMECDNLVLVAFVGEDTGWRAIGYQVWQPVPNRRTLLLAAKAILGQLSEDPSDAYGQAAARALESIHTKTG